MSKFSAKNASPKRRHKSHRAASKLARTVGKKVASERARHAQLKMDAPLQPFPNSTVHDSFRGLVERNVTQTRDLYEHSKGTLEAILVSWQNTFGAAGQGAVALNRRIIDIADHNINNTFDLAAELAGAKNLIEVLEVQAAYWRKQLTPGREK